MELDDLIELGLYKEASQVLLILPGTISQIMRDSGLKEQDVKDALTDIVDWKLGYERDGAFYAYSDDKVRKTLIKRRKEFGEALEESMRRKRLLQCK